MTIDERLARLAERHEALARSLEILVAANRPNSAANAKLAAANEARDKRMAEIMERLARLVHVAEIHQQRPEDRGGAAQ